MEINGYRIEPNANLRGANLRNADLRGTNLRGADLSGAHLYGANLRGANLGGIDFRDAHLYGANLRSAILRGADLGSADLRSADLRGADLRGADLRSANLDPHLVCPEIGAFSAFKKVLDANVRGWVIQIEIPADAQRCNAIGSRKCRASKVRVVRAFDTTKTVFYSKNHNPWIAPYRVGEITEADVYDFDPREECTGGIHFFMTRQEAEDW